MSDDRPAGHHPTPQASIRRDADETVFVVGWGNPGRLDDGLGPRLVEWLGALGIPGVHAETAYQLQVEHAEAVAGADVVVFVDADAEGPAPFLARPLEPAGRPAFSTHALTPGTVLALAAELFGARPRAVLLGIRGYAFDGFGERLSRRAEENLRAARAWIAAALAPPAGGSDEPTADGRNAGPAPAHAT